MSIRAQLFATELDTTPTVIAKNFSHLDQVHDFAACYLVGQKSANVNIYAVVLDNSGERTIQFTSVVPDNTLPQFPTLPDLATLLFIAVARRSKVSNQ